jgi:hypothetical protein
MSTDWLVNNPIDFEHKKYTLLAYFKKIDSLLEENKLYPTFIELSLHLASLQTLSKENVILYTDKLFKSYDDEVLLKEIKAKELPILSNEEFDEVNKIIKYSTTKFYDYFNIFKSYWSIVYDSVTIIPKKNKKNLNSDRGYFFYIDKKTNKQYVWEYLIKKYTPELNEFYTDINLIFEGDKNSKSLTEIIETDSHMESFIKKQSLPIFNLKATDDYPLFETLLPLFKRKLLSYVLQSYKINAIKTLKH